MANKKRSQAAATPIRVGVIGLGRGMGFAHGAGECVGMKLVALCDTWEAKLKQAGRQFPEVATYTDYDRFLEHEMDAVILANFFHQHAPFAVKALRAGMHVMSETSACKTLGEAAALARAVEQSGKTYMLAENYCFIAYNQEMRRLYRAGEIGTLRLGECEYIHPGAGPWINALSPGEQHWRNWIPSTYYCTHALGPMMYITDLRPVSVNAHSIDWAGDERDNLIVRQGDPGSTILCRMSNGATVIVNGLGLRGHSVWYRLHGSRGLMENLRHGDHGMLRVAHEPFDLTQPSDPTERLYRPQFPVYGDLAARAGHGGGDFFTNYFFAEAIRAGRQPWLDVYRGIDMSIVGIQAWKSCLANGAPFEVPDFRREAVRKKYEGEDWSPFAEDQRPGQPPPSIAGIRRITAAQRAAARAVWTKQGYAGQ